MRGAEFTYTLFKSETPDTRAFWDGPGMTSAAALDIFGCDEALAYTEAVMRWRLSALLPHVTAVLHDADHSCAKLDRALRAALQSATRVRFPRRHLPSPVPCLVLCT